MRKFAFTAIAASFIATPALADDVNWTGPYAGITAGWNSTSSQSDVTLGGNWANENSALRTLVATNFSTKQHTNNGNIGAHLGYNFQTGGLVLGAEFEASAVGGKAERVTSPVVYNNTSLSYVFANGIDPKSMMALKARLGAVVGGKTMIYATGGLAWVDADYAAGMVSSQSYQKLGGLSKTRHGFIVGGGIEHKLDSHLSIRAEYDYTDQGHVTYATSYLPGSSFAPPTYNYTETVSQDLQLHLLRVGVSYHF